MIKVCEGCTQSFIAFRTDVMYCTEVCRTQTRRNKKVDRLRLDRICVYCKAEFSTYTRNQLYCDILCRNKMHQTKQRAFRLDRKRKPSLLKSELEVEFYSLLESAMMAAGDKKWKKCRKDSNKAYKVADTTSKKVDAQYWSLYSSIQIGTRVSLKTITESIGLACKVMTKDEMNDHSSTIKRLECLIGQARSNDEISTTQTSA